MNDLNNSEAFVVPQSLSVNNNNHFKGPNIFLLRDKIISKASESSSECLGAVKLLALTDFDRKIRVNFKSVLKDLARGLNKIRYQIVLIQTIELLQLKGCQSIVSILEGHLRRSGAAKKLVDVFCEFEERSLLRNSYTQSCLRL